MTKYRRIHYEIVGNASPTIKRVVLLANEGYSNREIAKELNTSLYVVQHCLFIVSLAMRGKLSNSSSEEYQEMQRANKIFLGLSEDVKDIFKRVFGDWVIVENRDGEI